MKGLFGLLLAVTLVACQITPSATVRPTVVSDSAMVVCAHPLAARVGIKVLHSGGNATDAAVAVQFALAVVYPGAGNLGGGGLAVWRMNNGDTYSLDYREKAPENASTNMFLDETETVITDQSLKTPLASGVPGSVAGLWASHQRFGKLPWQTLVQPAIDLARNGFPLTKKEVENLNGVQQELLENNSVRPDAFIRDLWHEGDSLFLPDLARTLERIRDLGPKGFYEGETADLIVAEMQRRNGIITLNDLKNYVAVWRAPLMDYYKNFRIISMAPPSSGGVGLVQLLKSIEPYPVSEWGSHSAKTIHLFTEAQRRTYADRARYLGDPDFVSIPVKALISTSYVRDRMKSFDSEKATPSSAVQEGIAAAYESSQTTHLSVVDSEGNAVSATTTLNDNYGSKIVVAGAGFLLNNEMDDFSLKPGVPNMYGAIGGEANKILPGKRMLSSMTPTILEKNGELFMVIGSPGGTRIITSVFQSIVNVIEFGMNMQEAVDAKRVHSQWLPDEISPEPGALDEEVISKLKKRGHTITITDWDFGRVDAILVRENHTLEGGADSRGDDIALGF
jgi:gamma-glutamyltranspeptidase / glutathione hydrolase